MTFSLCKNVNRPRILGYKLTKVFVYMLYKLNLLSINPDQINTQLVSYMTGVWTSGPQVISLISLPVH